MSKEKYQEALDNIGWIVVDSGADGYHEPRTTRDFFFGDFVKLQQLIDIYPEYLELKSRATPKKPYKESLYDRICTVCNTHLDIDDKPNFCKCGQAIDWSEE